MKCPNCGVEYYAVKAGLTVQQGKLLEFITNYVTEHHGVSPSYDEMLAAMGLKSKSGINRLVVDLEERGHIARDKGARRSISLVAA